MLTEDEKYHVVQRLATDDEPDACRAFAKLAGIGCEGRECDGCMREAVDAIERRMMPEGMEWPRFEDGSPVRIGDEIALKGKTATVDSIQLHRKGVLSLWYDRGLASATYYGSAPVKHLEPGDTQERIDADAEKDSCEYFGFDGKLCYSAGGCPAHETVGSCELVKIKDLLRRQRELDARKDGAR